MSSTIISDIIAFAKKEFLGDMLPKVDRSKTQFQDLISAAKQATSLDEFKLYIAYKSAKAKKGDLWETLGSSLNDFIDKQIGNKTISEIEKLSLLQQAMGYLMWAAYAATKGGLKYV